MATNFMKINRIDHNETTFDDKSVVYRLLFNEGIPVTADISYLVAIEVEIERIGAILMLAGEKLSIPEDTLGLLEIITDIVDEMKEADDIDSKIEELKNDKETLESLKSDFYEELNKGEWVVLYKIS